MKIGLYGLHRGSADPEPVIRRAQLAEQAGFESLWVGDHLALPAEMGGQGLRYEAVVTVTFLAAVTTRVRLGIGVIVLPQRQPVLLAKQLTSVDVLSRGRLIAGFGVGYVEPELRALGVSPAERRTRTEEYLDVMRTLWTDPAPSYDGRFVSFSGVYQQPPPRQRPHPPIVIGGNSAIAMRRAVRVGNGWYGAYLDVDETAAHLARLREIQADMDRPAGLGELETTITPPVGPVDFDTARRYADLGVDRLAIQPADMESSEVEQIIETLGGKVIGPA